MHEARPPADYAAVSSAARQLTSRYRQHVSYEDVQQECYLWLWRNYDRAVAWREWLRWPAGRCPSSRAP